MKATEIQIGDWLNLSEIDGEVIPCKVVELHTDELIVRQPLDTACDIVGYDMIFPIPLTAEILEKNGLDKVPELSMVINRDTMPMYHSPMLHYVHELQQALRLCGLNELADNFKV